MRFDKHKIILFFIALAVSLIYGSHNFFMPSFLDDKSVYFPVTPSSNWDEAGFYAQRANAVYNGQWIAGDINLTEYKNGPSFLPILNPIQLGVLGKISGSIHMGFVLADFLYPPLIFLLLFFFALEFFASRAAAALFATIFVFSPLFAIYIPPISLAYAKQLVAGFFPVFGTPGALYFDRIEYPETTFVFYLAALYFIFRALKYKTRRDIILGGLFFGSTFYTYLFDWGYLLVGISILAILFLCQKKYSEFKILLYALLIGFIVSIPYWINLFELKALPQFKDIFYRTGMEISNAFRWGSVWKSYLRNIILTALIWMTWRKKDKLSVNFITAFLLAYFVVVNAQVITGFQAQPDHWYRIQFIFMALGAAMLLFWAYGRFIKNYIPQKLAVSLSGIFLIVFLLQQIYMQYEFSRRDAQRYAMPKELIASYEWLNKNSPKDSVVGSLSVGTNNEIMLYTGNKIFVPKGGNSLASNDEIWDRFIMMSKISGLDAASFKLLSRENIGMLLNDYYSERSLDTHFRSGTRKESDEVPGVIDAKTEEFKKIEIDPANLPYKLDYLYFGPKEFTIAGTYAPENAEYFELVYDQDGIRIYKLKAKQ